MYGILTSRVDAAIDSQAEELEARLCSYIGAGWCTLTTGVADALEAALGAAGVREGDSVLCTTLAYYSIPRAIAAMGARPMFVDINPNTLNIDPYCLEYVINKCIRTNRELPKAMIAVDLFGLPCNYMAIEEICERYGVTLIEDMTEAFGAKIWHKRAGSFGRFSVSRLVYHEENGGAEESGAVFCHSHSDSLLVRKLLREKKPGRDISRPEISVRLTLAGEALSMKESVDERRQAAAKCYRERLKPHIRMQDIPEGFVSAYSRFVILTANSDERAFVMDVLMENHIPCGIYYPVPLHQREAFTKWERVVLVNAEMISQRLLALPMHPYLSAHVIDDISANVIGAIKSFREEKCGETIPAAK